MLKDIETKTEFKLSEDESRTEKFTTLKFKFDNQEESFELYKTLSNITVTSKVSVAFEGNDVWMLLSTME